VFVVIFSNANAIDVPSFLEINGANRESIRTGTISFLYKSRKGEIRNNVMEYSENTLKCDLVFDLLNNSFIVRREPENEEDLFLGPLEKGQRLSDHQVRTTRLDHGGIYISYLPDRKIAVIRRTRPGNTNDDIPLLGTLDPKFVSGYDREEGTAREIEGRHLSLFEWHNERTLASFTVISDPSIGYRYRNMDLHIGDEHVRSYVADEYKFFGAIPFPTYHQERVFMLGLPDDSEDLIQRETTIQVLDACFNHELPPSTFSVDFAPGTRVQDFILDKDYTVGDISGVDYEELFEQEIENRFEESLLGNSLDNSAVEQEKTVSLEESPAPSSSSEPTGEGAEAASPSVGRRPRVLFLAAFGVVLVLIVCGGLRRTSRKQ